MASQDVPSTSSTQHIPSTQHTTTAKSLSDEDFAAYLNDARFNQTFQLPADPARGRPTPFQVSYADFGYRSGEDAHDVDATEHVFLFFGPLMSFRLFHAAKDALAKRYKIRIVTAERPGIGKTTEVPADKMLETWREAIPALLSHLRITRIACVGAHSGGTVYALDFCLHNPRLLLHPCRPYIAIAAPWVHPSHTGMLGLTIAANVLPGALVGQAGNLAEFANATLGPVAGVSAVVSGSVARAWPWQSSSASATAQKGRQGEDVQFEERLREQVAKQAFAEGVRGLGREVQVLLRNGAEEQGWGHWGEYDALVPRLADGVKGVSGGKRLRVDVFFSEKDHMIGDAGGKGTEWFEACWRGVDGVDFTSEVVKGADHDGVWDLRWDVMERVFKTITAKS